MEQILVVIFTLGIAIFVFLSMLEIPVWKVIFSGSARGIPESSVRFVHKNLKYMTSKLPATNGLVIVSGLGLMILQVVKSEWATLPTAQLAVYVSGLILIVAVLGNPKTVFSIRAHDSERENLDSLLNDLRKVGRDHHIGLVLNLTALLMQLNLIWS